MSKFKTPEDMAHIIRHSYVAEDYKPELLTQVVDILADPSKCIQMISSKSFEDSTLPNNMYWYKFNYSLDKVTEERLQQLRAPVVPDNGKPLDLPPANNFIATNFDILPEDSSLSARPMLVQQWEDRADLWYKKDDKFKKPKGTIACKIYTDDLMFGQSTQTTVFADLWK